jgi:hypothetical protein
METLAIFNALPKGSQDVAHLLLIYFILPHRVDGGSGQDRTNAVARFATRRNNPCTNSPSADVLLNAAQKDVAICGGLADDISA